MADKLLTDAEIARLLPMLMIARGYGAYWSTEIAEGAKRLLDEVRHARALLRRIEWCATEDGYPTCPCCAGRNPEARQEEEREDGSWWPVDEGADEKYGHKPGCELAALIGTDS